MRKYCEQLCANKLANLDEMDKFLQKKQATKIDLRKIENLNIPITTKRLGQ